MTPERDEREEPRTPELNALLEAARRPGVSDPSAQEQALAAFRTARDAGLHAAPVPWWRRRARDDWRPEAERRRGRLLVRGLIAGLVMGALGGVAVAAGNGALPIPSPFGGSEKPGRDEPQPVQTRSTERARTQPGTPEASLTPSPTPGSGATGLAKNRPSGMPPAAEDALCRVYLDALDRKGEPPRGEAMARLEAQAGGPEAVRAWCEEKSADAGQLRPDGPKDGPGAGPVVSPEAEKPPKEREPGKPTDRPR
ncbi:hypothetical protein [Streptomyces wuyuanensis]|uniref:hypothetical protein n=1 Tax=Streptomyces wuyuanensis TaxID=1196353 RepID=UPI00341DD9F6